MRGFVGSAILATVLVAAPAYADVVIGSPADAGTGNSYPFGSAYAGEYQQVYTSGAFSGPMTITDLEFFNTQVDFGATAMNSGTWTISLSTTSANWNSLSDTFASNIGADNTVVFSGDLTQPWAFGDTLHIDLSTPFSYNPGDGNLLLDIVATGTSAGGGEVFFDSNGYNGGGFNGDTILGRVYCPGGIDCGLTGSINSGYGLVTGFSTTTGSVPEPATLALFGAGIVGLGRLRRRRAKA